MPRGTTAGNRAGVFVTTVRPAPINVTVKRQDILLMTHLWETDHREINS